MSILEEVNYDQCSKTLILSAESDKYLTDLLLDKLVNLAGDHKLTARYELMIKNAIFEEVDRYFDLNGEGPSKISRVLIKVTNGVKQERERRHTQSTPVEYQSEQKLLNHEPDLPFTIGRGRSVVWGEKTIFNNTPTSFAVLSKNRQEAADFVKDLRNTFEAESQSARRGYIVFHFPVVQARRGFWTHNYLGRGRVWEFNREIGMIGDLNRTYDVMKLAYN